MTVQVLLVEDSAQDVDLVSEALEGEDVTVEHVDHLATALAKLEESDFDAVLLDLNLPDSNGLATLDAVLPAAPGVAVIVLTTAENEGMGEDAIRAGAQDFLVKGGLADRLLPKALRFAVARQAFITDAPR